MNKEVCENCNSIFCLMFFGHDKDNKKYVHVYEDIDPPPRETYWADAIILKRESEKLICRRAMYENWTSDFPWQYDDVVPEDSNSCIRYAEHLVSMLNRGDK